MLLKKSEAIWVPVAMALESRDEKLVLLALGAVQRVELAEGAVAR
jgi:DNA-binding phage protein